MNVPHLIEMQEQSGVVPVQLQERFDPSIENKYELPEKWSRHKIWYVKEALLLLAGFDPDYTTLAIDDVEKSIKIKIGVLMLGDNFEEVFGEYCASNREMCEHEELLLRSRIDGEEYKLIRQYPRSYVFEELSSEAQKYIRNARMIACYNKALSSFDYFWDYWKRQLEPEDDINAELRKSDSVKSYCRWAIEYKITDKVPWWTDTLANKYIAKEETHQGGEIASGQIDDRIEKWKEIHKHVNSELTKLGKPTIEPRTLQNYHYNATNGEKAKPPKKTLKIYKAGRKVYTFSKHIKEFAESFNKHA